MYNNIGKKIKNLAQIIACGGIILSLIVGIIVFYILNDSYYTEDKAYIGIIVAVVGGLFFWIAGFFSYGFGEIIDQTMDINKKLSVSRSENNIKEKIMKLKEWREKELITEEEFEEKISAL